MRKGLLHLFRTLIAFSMWVTVSHPAIGQNLERCGTSAYTQLLLSENPGLEQTRTEISNAVRNYLELNAFQDFKNAASIIRIPVVVHLIGDNVIAMVSEQRVQQQIDVLNQDYRKIQGTNGNGNGVDTEIEFCLTEVDVFGYPSSGIFTYPGIYPEWNYYAPSTASDSDHELKSIGHWSSVEFLNLYVADLCCDILGYATFPEELTTLPERDGVVIDPDYFGISGDDRFGYGRTATHEVGHWLGLRHTWGDGDCSVDDGVDDTPICDGQFFSRFYLGCNVPSPPQCTVENVVAGLTDIRQIENYMDYSDDLCMNMFTQGQADRMLGYLASVRLFTLFSQCTTGINPPPPPPPIDPIPCEVCINIWPNFSINGHGWFDDPYRVNICEGNPIVIGYTYGCKFWHCFKTFFSIQECDYHGLTIGPEYTKWYDYGNPAEELFLSSLVADVGAPPLYPGKYYRIKFANRFTGWAGVGWTDRLRLLHIIPVDKYLENPVAGQHSIPDQVFALQNIETVGSNLTVSSGEFAVFNAGNKIILNPGFDVEFGANFTAQISDVSCPSFRLGVFESWNDTIIKTDDDKPLVFPNPNSGAFTIVGTQIQQIQVSDASGKLVQSKLGNLADRVEISGLSPGLYIVRVQMADGRVENAKVVVN